MARIDVLKEEIAEARTKRRNTHVCLLLCGMIVIIAALFSPVYGGEAKDIWTIIWFIFFIALCLGGYSWYIDKRIKKLMKELEVISQRA